MLKEVLQRHKGHDIKIIEQGDKLAIYDEESCTMFCDTEFHDLVGVNSDEYYSYYGTEELPVSRLSASDLFAKMTSSQRQTIYMMCKYDEVYEDTLAYLEDCDEDIPDDQNFIDCICEDVANDYVYHGGFNADIPYWKNIENLVKHYLEDYY